ncbi:MAG: hypothetical protein VR65_23930 [Desulfobulbaceae bacterium BRH_c16a]|nr:MAG: hypothetical protein VR65_23930 [Desulfobulbaceae bacterium BRH_c16a]
MKRTAKGEKILGFAKLLYPLMFSLLLSGCSYYDRQFSYFNMLDEKKRTLSNKQAAEKFWATVRPVSTLSDSHYRLGLHYQQKGEYDKAIGEFTKALRNDNTYCKAYNGIAMSYDVLRRCEPAHDSYDKALKCAPDQAYVYNNYACSSLLCGDYGKGVELLLKAELLADNDNRIKNNLKIARNIVIHENISDNLPVGQSPEVITKSGSTSLPEQEKPQIHPVYVVSENILNTTVVSNNREIHDTPTDNIPASTLGTDTPIVADPVKFVAEKSKIIVLPNPILSSLSPATVAVEVSNGNGTTGMAGRSAGFLRGHGFKIQSITNATHYRFEESIIFYKEEYLQVAKDLAAIIPGAQVLEKVDTMAKPFIGIRVLLGRDLAMMRFPEGFDGIAGYSGPTSKVSVLNNVVQN